MRLYSFQIEPEYAAVARPLWSDPRPCPWNAAELAEIREIKKASAAFGRRDSDFQTSRSALEHHFLKAPAHKLAA